MVPFSIIGVGPIFVLLEPYDIILVVYQYIYVISSINFSVKVYGKGKKARLEAVNSKIIEAACILRFK